MSNDVLSLWFPEVKAPAETPQAILRAQADELAKLTNGILIGNVQQWPDEEDKLKITLEIIAPELYDDSRFRILSVQHDRLMPYPAFIDAEVFRLKGLAAFATVASELTGDRKKPENRADDDPEFRDLLKKVLHSPAVKALVSSLRSRVTEQRKALTAGAPA